MADKDLSSNLEEEVHAKNLLDLLKSKHAVEKKIADEVGLQRNLAREMKVLSSKNIKNQQEQLNILDDLKDAQFDFAKESGNNLKTLQKELPFQEKILRLKGEQNRLQQIINDADGDKFRNLNGEERSLKATVDLAIQQYQALQQQMVIHEKVVEAQEKGLELFGMSRDRVKEIGDTIEHFITNPWLILIGLIGLSIHKLTEYQEILSDIRRDSGLTRDSMNEIKAITKDIVYSNRELGLEFAEVGAIATEFVKSGESVLLINKELVSEVAKYSKILGVSAEDGAKLALHLRNTGMAQQDISDSFDNILQLSNQYGVSASAIVGDIATSFEKGYNSLSQYPQELIKTAARLRAVGLNMEKVLDIAEGLLDVESSIQAEMEAVLLTGKKINLDAARYYALTGNVAKLGEEILKNIGSVEEFNKMLPLQQESYAKALGMSTDELVSMARRHEAMNRLQTGQATLQDKMNQNLEEQLTSVEKIKNAFTAIYSAISVLLLPILEPVAFVVGEIASGVSTLANMLRTDSPIMNWIFALTAGVGAWKLIPALFSKIGAFGTRAFSSMVSKGGALSKVFSFLSPAGGGATAGATDRLGKFGSFIQGMDPTKMLAGGAAMVLVASAMFILGKSFQEFAQVSWDGFARGLIALASLTASTIALGLIMTSGIGTVAILAGAGAMIIMAGAMWVMGDAMQKIASSSVGFDKVMQSLMSVDASHILALAGSFALLAPAMMGFSVAAATLGTVGTVFGVSPGVNREDKMDTVIDKLDMINDTLEGLDLMVELDGVKVNKGLAKSSAYGVT